MLGEMDSHMQKNEVVPLPYTILTHTALNVRCKIIKLLEESIWPGLVNDFIAMSSKTQATKKWTGFHQN